MLRVNPPAVFHLAVFRSAFFLAILFGILAPAAHAILPKGDVYLGYSRLGANDFYATDGGLNGLEAAAHLKLGHFLGAEADVAHYGYGASAVTPRTTTFLVGPRLTVGLLGVKIFAHGLIGGQHSATSGQSGTESFSFSDNDFAYAVGGGADFPIAPFFALRVNGDFLASRTIAANHSRISTGLVFHF